MDSELRDYLQTMEDRTAVRIASEIRASEERTAARIATQVAAEIQASEQRTAARIATEIRASEERTAALIAAEVGSLHTDIEHRFAHVEARFDSVDARLKLHAGLIQSGARAMARFSSFSERSEERWGELDRQVEAIERKLQNGASGMQ